LPFAVSSLASIQGCNLVLMYQQDGSQLSSQSSNPLPDTRNRDKTASLHSRKAEGVVLFSSQPFVQGYWNAESI